MRWDTGTFVCMLGIVGGKHEEYRTVLYPQRRGEGKVVMAMMLRFSSSEHRYRSVRRGNSEIMKFVFCLSVFVVLRPRMGKGRKFSQCGEPMRCLLGLSYRSQR